MNIAKEVRELHLTKLRAQHDYLCALRAIYEPRFMAETAEHAFDKEDDAYPIFFGDMIQDSRKRAVQHHALVRLCYPGDVACAITRAYLDGDAAVLDSATAHAAEKGTLGGWVAPVPSLPEAGDEETLLWNHNLRTMCMLWYRWFFEEDLAGGGQTALKRIFVSPSTMEDRAETRRQAASAETAGRQAVAAAQAEYEALVRQYDIANAEVTAMIAKWQAMPTDEKYSTGYDELVRLQDVREDVATRRNAALTKMLHLSLKHKILIK